MALFVDARRIDNGKVPGKLSVWKSSANPGIIIRGIREIGGEFREFKIIPNLHAVFEFTRISRDIYPTIGGYPIILLMYTATILEGTRRVANGEISD